MNSPLPRNKRSSAGVTLVELLVAILVMAVLAALLFGAAQRSGAAAQNAKCVANLRTVGLGALRFMQDRGGTLLPSKFFYNWSTRTDSRVGFRDYVGILSPNTKVTAPEFLVDSPFTCPAVKRDFPEMFPTYLNRCYVANFYAHKDDPENLDEPLENQKPPSPSFAGRLVNIPSPSKMWMFADPAVKIPVPSIATYVKPTAFVSGGAYRIGFHGGRNNTVFFDGHVEALTREDFYTRSKREFWGIANAAD